MAKKLRTAKFRLNARIEKMFMGKVRPIGNSAHVIVPKDFAGREVFVLLPVQTTAKCSKGVKVF